MFKTVHHSPVIYIFLKDQSLDCYNKFSVSGGSISDTPWYLERGEQKKRHRLLSCLSAFHHEERAHAAAKHISHKAVNVLGLVSCHADADL